MKIKKYFYKKSPKIPAATRIDAKLSKFTKLAQTIKLDVVEYSRMFQNEFEKLN